MFKDVTVSYKFIDCTSHFLPNKVSSSETICIIVSWEDNLHEPPTTVFRKKDNSFNCHLLQFFREHVKINLSINLS